MNQFWALLNSFGIFAVIATNFLANFLPINGVRTGEISATYENLFTPAGFTFSIWGVIYLFLIGFVNFLFFTSGHSRDTIVQRAKLSILLSSALNILWILAWHHQKIGWSLIIMFGLLLSLTYINVTLYNFRIRNTVSKAFFWLVRTPFSLYLGWIVIATVANFAAFLTATGWGALGFLPEFWVAIMVIMAFSIGLLLLIRLRSFASVAAICWGLFGLSANLNSKDEDLLLIYLIYGCLIVLVISLIYKMSKHLKLTFG